MSSVHWTHISGVMLKVYLSKNEWRSMEELPVNTEISDMMSKDLKRRGFNFVGSTICYAFMQAVGMVNDHTTYCFRHDEIKKLAQQVG